MVSAPLKEVRCGSLRMKSGITALESEPIFCSRVRYGVRGADDGALTVRKEADALGATVGFNHWSQGARMNCFIRTFPFARAALKAGVINLQAHVPSPGASAGFGATRLASRNWVNTKSTSRASLDSLTSG
jgi:hypothetical protein